MGVGQQRLYSFEWHQHRFERTWKRNVIKRTIHLVETNVSGQMCLPAVMPATDLATYSLTPNLTSGCFVPSYKPNMSDNETVRCASGGKMPR